MIIFSKYLVKLVKIYGIVISHLKKFSYRLMYENLSFAKKVYLGKGVKISITDGGSLHIGENTCVDRFTNIRVNGGDVVVGDNSYVGEFCYLASNVKVFIGNGSLIASHVVIRDNQHKYEDVLTPVHLQGNECKDVVIGENVWLGTKATVLMGVTVGSDTIIGAHSLVNKNMDKGYICAGSPCRPIRKR